MKTRNTRQKEILTESIKKFDSFFTAEDLFKEASKKDPKLGIATTYRFLNNLVKNKRLYSYLCDRKTLYAKQKKSHCHFSCEKTGKIIHFQINNLNFLKEIKNKIPGTINSIQLEIKGVCKDCKN